MIRTIAMNGANSPIRAQQVESAGGSVTVPMGKRYLGHIMNLIGKPLDKTEPIGAKKPDSAHQLAPALAKDNTACQPLFTGIKVWDLRAPPRPGVARSAS